MKHKHLIFALSFALLNAGGVFLIFGFQRYGDTVGLLDTIRSFWGKGDFVVFPLILRPLGPFLAMPFEFLGEGAGLIIQNIIFYLLATVLIFKIVDLIYHNKQQALLASFFFVTAVSVIESGLAYLTDMGAWFFYILSIFLTLLYFKNKNEKLIILNGVLSGMGVLMKENGGLGVVFFGLMVLFSGEFNLKEKISKIMNFGIFFLIPIITVQVFTFKYFQFTSLDWYSANKPSNLLDQDGLVLFSLRWFGQFLKVLGILWIFFFIGLWRELREKNQERIKIYLALIPSSFSFLLWSVEAAGRSAFIFAPLGILLVTYGLSFLDKKLGKKRGALMMVLLILAVLFVNYYFCWFNHTITFVDKVAEFLGIWP